MALSWTQKIGAGMDLICAGCKENADWSKCGVCPFGNFCDVLMESYNGQAPATLFAPENEKIKERN